MEHSSQSAIERFLKRLLLRSKLTHEEQQAILGLTGESRCFAARRDIVSPGERVERACLVASGLAGRFDQMLDGRRQTTSFYMSGDMCDLHSVVAPKATWSITAVSEVTVFRIGHHQLQELCVRYPAVALAFWRDTTADASVFAKWVGNLGRKDSRARIAHVFCEMGMRAEAAELGSRTSFAFEVTQEQLAEAVGITPVHVNRTLQEIRGEGLLGFQNGWAEIHDWDGLTSVAEFDPSYLMLGGPPLRVAPSEERDRSLAM